MGGAAYLGGSRVDAEWRFLAKLYSRDTQTGDVFGQGVALAERLAGVGAPGADDRGFRSGAGYIFEADEQGEWAEVAKVLAGDGGPDDSFGTKALMPSDVEVWFSAEDHGFAGAVYIFERIGSEWVQVQKLEPQGASLGARFAFDIAIDGDVFVGGAWVQYEQDTVGAAFVFERDGNGVWRQTAKLLASDGRFDARFGWSVAVRGNLIAVGATAQTTDPNAPGHGAVYIFRKDGDGEWSEETKLISPQPKRGEKLGSDLAISGNLIYAGARCGTTCEIGSVFVFRDNGPGQPFEFVTQFTGHDVANMDLFGYFLDVDWPYLVVGSPNHDGNWEDSGAAYIFELERCGDIDGDGDVDLDDHARFHECISGPSGGVRVLCAPADLDRDGDVDLSDYRFLQPALADAE
jgi:hypothetical protein